MTKYYCTEMFIILNPTRKGVHIDKREFPATVAGRRSARHAIDSALRRQLCVVYGTDGYMYEQVRNEHGVVIGWNPMHAAVVYDSGTIKVGEFLPMRDTGLRFPWEGW